MGGFDLIHEMALRIKEGARQTGDYSTMNLVEYHPAKDVTSMDCSDPDAWWYYIVEMPYATEDMFNLGGNGIAFDGKLKLVLDVGNKLTT